MKRTGFRGGPRRRDGFTHPTAARVHIGSRAVLAVAQVVGSFRERLARSHQDPVLEAGRAQTHRHVDDPTHYCETCHLTHQNPPPLDSLLQLAEPDFPTCKIYDD